MRKLLEYVGSPDGSIYTGIVWIILLMISDLLRVTFFSWGWSVCYRTGLRMKSAFTSVMYRKLIKTSNLSNQDSGKVCLIFLLAPLQLFLSINKLFMFIIVN